MSQVKVFHQTNTSLESLQNAVGEAIIIAYKESTELLKQELLQAGIPCQILRQEDRPEYREYASAYRCLLNHTQAWQIATQSNRITLILEADFVPVVGMGNLPLPFALDSQDVGIAWLYTCAPQVYSVTEAGFAEGYSTSLVAYIVTPQSAKILCELEQKIKLKYGTGYCVFDSEIDCFLRTRNLKNYITFRNYGEHGGIPNPEHRRHNLSGVHRADVLYGPLAFQPLYSFNARNSRLTFLWVRLQARLKGLLRLITGRFLRFPILQGSSFPGRLLGFAVRRQLSRWL